MNLWIFKGQTSLKVFFLIMSMLKIESKFECRPNRKLYFEIWIYFYAMTSWQKETFKPGSALIFFKDVLGCNIGEHQCDSGECLDNSFICNQIVDCPNDNSDERNCPAPGKII